jgi:hypothetical protein
MTSATARALLIDVERMDRISALLGTRWIPIPRTALGMPSALATQSPGRGSDHGTHYVSAKIDKGGSVSMLPVASHRSR